MENTILLSHKTTQISCQTLTEYGAKGNLQIIDKDLHRHHKRDTIERGFSMVFLNVQIPAHHHSSACSHTQRMPNRPTAEHQTYP